MTIEQPLRILHLASSERWTGVAEPVVSVAREQMNAGHEVWLACVPGQSFERRARALGLRMVDEFHLDRRLHPVNLVRDFIGLRRFVVRHRMDVVHSHLLNDNWLAGLALVGVEPPPLLVRTFHRWEPPRNDPFHQWLFGRRNNVTIATSQSLLDLFNGRIALAPQSVKVTYGGVEYERFHPEVSGEAVRREFGLPPDAPVAGIVARMTPGRGHRWLMNAVPEIARRLPEAQVALVGRGPLKKPLRAEINGSALRRNVVMMGYRRPSDLPETYAAFDVSLFLGMGSEGTCRAALEAMASGLPVIAVRAGALPEIVEDGKTGVLVEPDNAAALAQAIVELLGNRQKRARMAAAARQAILERFTEKQRAQSTLEAYRAARRPVSQ